MTSLIRSLVTQLKVKCVVTSWALEASHFFSGELPLSLRMASSTGAAPVGGSRGGKVWDFPVWLFAVSLPEELWLSLSECLQREVCRGLCERDGRFPRRLHCCWKVSGGFPVMPQWWYAACVLGTGGFKQVLCGVWSLPTMPGTFTEGPWVKHGARCQSRKQRRWSPSSQSRAASRGHPRFWALPAPWRGQRLLPKTCWNPATSPKTRPVLGLTLR